MISLGKRAGHRYFRTGRLVLWLGRGRGRDLLAVWWLDRGRRALSSGVVIKPPWKLPRYSEVHGNQRLLFKFFGWRLLPLHRM
ncbi:MAG: hypothetical protein PSV46_02755 [Reyranella sp.]|nr:hypothetical protein [Reyranella sp.]